MQNIRNNSLELARPTLSRLFGEMSDETFTEISEMLTWMHFQSDDCIFRESEEGNSMFIVVNGRLRVVVENNDKPKIVAEIGKGECVGEMSLLSGNPRNASVYAVRDSDLLRLNKASFEKIVHINPEAGLNLSKVLIDRFSEKKASRLIKSITNITLLSLHQSIDLLEAKSDLEKALDHKKRITVVTSESVDQKFGEALSQTPSEDTLQNSKLSHYLNDLEEQNDFVFYLPDLEKSEWTKRCVRQADEILLIADSQESSKLTRLEEELFYNRKQKYSSARQTLLLIHPKEVDLPTGTEKWLDERREIDFHMHLRHSNSKDYQRLARYLKGNTIGMVLALSLIHI